MRLRDRCCRQALWGTVWLLSGICVLHHCFLDTTGSVATGVVGYLRLLWPTGVRSPYIIMDSTFDCSFWFLQTIRGATSTGVAGYLNMVRPTGGAQPILHLCEV